MLEDIDCIILISTDALGPAQKTLVVERTDGSVEHIERRRDISRFIQGVHAKNDDLAKSLENAINERTGMANYERVLYRRPRG